MNASQSRFLAVAVLVVASVAFGSIVSKGFFGVFEAY